MTTPAAPVLTDWQLRLALAAERAKAAGLHGLADAFLAALRHDLTS